MARKKNKPDGGHGDTSANCDQSSSDAVRTSGWTEKKRRSRLQAFPGPRGVTEPVRLWVSGDAYAELLFHAKQCLDVEVCGVLIGEFRADDEGEYVFVEAIIRGEAARESDVHVTFTQETWNRIHERRERDYSGHDIVGWYHTHPGFGVEFSEMDLFIHRNFFSRRNQVALVTDPLGGEEAVCVNTADGIDHLSRFWVDGRERRCRSPGRGMLSEKGVPTPDRTEGAAALQAVEDRLGQLIAAVDEQRSALYRFLLVIGMVACVGIAVLIGHSIYSRVVSEQEPPETIRYAEIPIRVGDETYFLGVQVVRWKAPERVWSGLVKAVQQALEAEEEARRKGEAVQGAEQSDQSPSKPSPRREEDKQGATSNERVSPERQ